MGGMSVAKYDFSPPLFNGHVSWNFLEDKWGEK